MIAKWPAAWVGTAMGVAVAACSEGRAGGDEGQAGPPSQDVTEEGAPDEGIGDGDAEVPTRDEGPVPEWDDPDAGSDAAEPELASQDGVESAGELADAGHIAEERDEDGEAQTEEHGEEVTAEDVAEVEEVLGPEEAALALVLVQLGPDGEATAMVEGMDLEIVQGPQGGIHLEVAGLLSVPGATADYLKAKTLTGRTTVDGEEVGGIDGTGFLLTLVADGVYRTTVVPFFFETNTAGLYAGKDAEVSLRVELASGEAGKAAIGVHLVDLF